MFVYRIRFFVCSPKTQRISTINNISTPSVECSRARCDLSRENSCLHQTTTSFWTGIYSSSVLSTGSELDISYGSRVNDRSACCSSHGRAHALPPILYVQTIALLIGLTTAREASDGCPNYNLNPVVQNRRPGRHFRDRRF